MGRAVAMEVPTVSATSRDGLEPVATLSAPSRGGGAGGAMADSRSAPWRTVGVGALPILARRRERRSRRHCALLKVAPGVALRGAVALRAAASEIGLTCVFRA